MARGKNQPVPPPDEMGAPSDWVELAVAGVADQPTGVRWVFCNVGGTLVWTDYHGNTVTWNLTGGVCYPIQPKNIDAASTAIVFLCY